MVETAEDQPGVLNPLVAARRLKVAGIEPDQAEAIASEIIAGQGGLATMADLQLAFADLRTEIRRAFNRMMIAQVVVGGLVVAAVKYLP